MVELTGDDAAIFRLYQQYHANLTKIINSKVLDIRNGAAVLHLDGAGNIKKIERHDHIFLDAP